MTARVRTTPGTFFSIALIVVSSSSLALANLESFNGLGAAPVGNNNFDIREKSVKDQECLDLPFSVCLGNGARMITPAAKTKNLAGWWKFDDSMGYDSTGHGNDVFPIPNVGPAKGGVGYSARFNGTSMSAIPHSRAFQWHQMTISFWIYLLQDSTGGWRTILKKGTETDGTPNLMLWPNKRKIHARVTTELEPNAGLESIAVLPLRRWTHVAFTMQGKLLQLYVNGMLDSQTILGSEVMYNDRPLFLGKDPWHPGTAMFLDDLRVHGAALNAADVAALAGPALGAAGPDSVVLGCESKPCPLSAALEGCPPKHHLCDLKELYTMGLSVARAQGWLHLNPRVWPRGQAEDGCGSGACEKRLALCCKS